MKTQSFKDLIVWQRSYELVLEIYKMTSVFPKTEVYGLSQQMRRAAVSVPSNIAEGYGRKHKAEYNQFLSIAYGSLLELETQFLLAKDLKFVNENRTVGRLLKEVGSMLYRMLHPIR
ncbi:MAG: four helix bundle protein [Planctomycetota bacterium]|jgi:four helix bundle protein